MSRFHRYWLLKRADDVQPQQPQQPQQPGSFNQNIYDAMKRRSHVLGGIGGLGALGGIAGAAIGNKALGIGGALVGAAGLLSGWKTSHDAAKYQNDESFRQQTNKVGLFNNYNDLAVGGQLGLPSWAM